VSDIDTTPGSACRPTLHRWQVTPCEAVRSAARGPCRQVGTPSQRPRPRPLTTSVKDVFSRRLTHRSSAQMRQRREHPRTPQWGVGGRGAKLRSEGPRRAATRVRETRRQSAATVSRGDRRGVGYADRGASFDRAQRRVKRSPASPPLMLFLFLPRIRSYSAGSRSLLLLYQRFLLSTDPLSTDRFGALRRVGLSTGPSKTVGKSGFRCRQRLDAPGV